MPPEPHIKIAAIIEALEIGDELFWEPLRQARPGAWTGHLAAAFWLIKAVKPRIFVELGTHSGNSYSAFCQAIALLRLPTRAFAVDTWQGDEHAGFFDEGVFKDLNAFNESHFTGFSKLLRATFDEARCYFSEGSIDLLHIDGLHTYEAVKHDLDTWKSALSSSAVVVFHDTNVRERGFGVWKLWQELAESYPSFEFHHSEGLGILGIGQTQPPLLSRLFELGKDLESSAIMRRLFAARGETFRSRAQTLDLEGLVASLSQDVRQKSQRVSDLEQEVVGRDAILSQREQELQLKNEIIGERQEEIRRNHEIIQQRERTIASKDETVNTKQRRIAELEQSVGGLHHQLAGANEQHNIERSEAADRISQLQQELASFQKKLGLIESSTSWRAISQVRAAFDSHPKLRLYTRRVVRLMRWTASLQLVGRLRARRRLFKARDKIAASALFDRAWYLLQYPDVAEAGWDPALHYALFGATERRNPGPQFDAEAYLLRNPDVVQAGANPLVHYLEYGASEGRRISSVDAEASVPESRRPITANDYQTWVERYDALSEEDKSTIRNHVDALRERPLISVVIPVYNTRPMFLRRALDSVLAQLYPVWELCIADDASTNPEIRTILDEYAQRDRRIRVVYRQQNGHIAAASNSALELVTGEFVALMDHDDELPPHALYMVAVELNDHPEADVVYSDEDKINADGQRHGPYFKTDWNPELFYAQNFINHLGIYRASLVKEIGGFREGFDGSQDYDLALRIISRIGPNHIRHIPHILYHWRLASDVQTFSSINLNTAVEAAHRALADYFAARRQEVRITASSIPSWNRVIRPLPDPLPRVSLIVPTRDKVELLRKCVDGLLHKTSYPNLELIIVDNDSQEKVTLDYLQSLQDDSRVRILRMEGPFNYSALNNQAAAAADGELLAFINNDIDVIGAGWLSEMVSQAVQPGVGSVGAKLYYPDDTIQHAGVVIGMCGVAAHGHRLSPRSSGGYFGRLQLVQNVSCVTAACMVVSKNVFLAVGGFNEDKLKVSLNDVDLCLKIRAAGYNIVWTPHAELYHAESVSRGYDHHSPEKTKRALTEVEYMRSRWSTALEYDPYYNPNLSLADESFRLAFPPRVTKPWRRAPVAASDTPDFGGNSEHRHLSHAWAYLSDDDGPFNLPGSMAIGVSSLGNFFMTEIARMLDNAFRNLGVRTRLFTESEAEAVLNNDAVIVIAPHEFFLLGDGPNAFEVLKRVPTLVQVNTEQQQTPWFGVAERYLRSASAVLDINSKSARQLARSGYRAFALPLGFSEYIAQAYDGAYLSEHKLFQHLESAAGDRFTSCYRDRPIDILFVGTSSQRRCEFFARNAAFFASKNTFIYIPDGAAPFRENEPRTLDFAALVALVKRSKVFLNVHRDEAAYFEWQRIVTLGIMQQTLVVTEHCESEPCVVPNFDYLDGPLEGLTGLCELALNDCDLAESVSLRAYERLKANWRMERILGRCWNAMAGQAAGPRIS